MTAPDADAVIPYRDLFALLARLAGERGFRARGYGLGAAVLCAACHPDQPARLVRPDGHEDDWSYSRRGWRHACGLVLFELSPPHSFDPRTVVLVDDIESVVVASACCHEPDVALAGWDWLSDLLDAADRAFAADDGAWADEWRRARLAHAASVADQRARQEVAALAAALGHRARVQVVAAVAKDLGREGVMVDEARIRWECGHVDEAGSWSHQVVVVEPSGLVRPADASCPRHQGAPVPLDALAAGYRAVAALPEEERARFRPVPERGRSGRPGRGRAPAPPRVTDRELDDLILAVCAEAEAGTPLGARSLREAVRARTAGVSDGRIDQRRQALVGGLRLAEEKSGKANAYRPLPLAEA